MFVLQREHFIWKTKKYLVDPYLNTWSKDIEDAWLFATVDDCFSIEEECDLSDKNPSHFFRHLQVNECKQ